MPPSNKVESATATTGPEGQKYLARGTEISMRLWEKEEPGTVKQSAKRSYETVGFVLDGVAELTVEGQKTKLTKGISWVVPKNAEHTYQVLETFTAVEATSPPEG